MLSADHLRRSRENPDPTRITTIRRSGEPCNPPSNWIPATEDVLRSQTRSRGDPRIGETQNGIRRTCIANMYGGSRLRPPFYGAWLLSRWYVSRPAILTSPRLRLAEIEWGSLATLISRGSAGIDPNECAIFAHENSPWPTTCRSRVQLFADGAICKHIVQTFLTQSQGHRAYLYAS